ncbi:aminomethyl-transferring glycine dehydrogenase subunit GcvPA [Spirochaeta isovalerica]|uniref:Probable glycine dehydrogenase (decarboxylating) subunit 1 n=1 Tax=Spirochaeta isovalerica TaxID=150 RepID=A0A841RD96_9SPIO|nr:aminomethyl-transferring glycine dehydrogenase subunit GcvPA [Spirochaeta isovalerica]MBB6481616.1 glycine dehydrogenase subunit 1 [Spirochaeta isovalerica]
MSFISNMPKDREMMLKKIGVSSVDELFKDVPADKRFPRVDMPKPLSEPEILLELSKLSAKNASAECYDWFLGAGVYNHFVPSVVGALITRGEFLTAYTPYQPEVSQGTLEAIFEYQTMISELTGMDVVNASHYDGATALAEAAIMSVRSTRKRHKVVLAQGLHPEYRDIIETYFQGLDMELSDGDLDDQTAGYIVQNPTWTGEILDVKAEAAKAHDAGAMLIVHTDPISLGVLEAPGACGADIVTAEGQSLGVGMNWGGPMLGIFATTQKNIRKMPGRIIGETIDERGNRGCVLTFAAREQHIRREKATSNICSNQGLAALSAAIYLAALGKSGFKKVAELSWHKAHYAAAEIARIDGFSLKTKGHFFKEFLVETPVPAEDIFAKLKEKFILPGLPLSRLGGGDKELLVCVTEVNSKEQIDRLVAALKEVK